MNADLSRMGQKLALAEERLTGSIVGSFFDVYNYYGFGLLESAYAGALERDLIAKGHKVIRELAVPVRYKGDIVAWQRLDMVVDDKVIVELKATEKMPAPAERQLLAYLKVSRFPVGLLLHFGMRPSFRRYVRKPDLR